MDKHFHFLLDLVDRAKGVNSPQRRKAGNVAKDYRKKDAVRLIQAAGPGLGLPTGLVELAELRKGDPLKEATSPQIMLISEIQPIIQGWSRIYSSS